ncbi:hypothetical protein ACVRY7_10870 [Streptococcus ictaluri]|uniref:Thioredoxin domain-containing protein n=1 Tax=Streptococcus ictaluri 707-05 TaxID=764299 RepID=G5K575_9STRE|nr:hypothetical protein [Streptococcus ictaluri]EHI69211.1 hypothetical protein STRIC_1968 [Streptococcus ictaluri 707-05]
MRRTGIILGIGGLLIILGLGVYFSIGHNYENQLTQDDYSNVLDLKTYNIVCYKKGCPFCESSQTAILKAKKKSPITTFFVDVDSKEGQKVVKKYSIEKAYSIIVVRENFAKVYRYAYKENGKIGPNTDVINQSFRK